MYVSTWSCLLFVRSRVVPASLCLDGRACHLYSYGSLLPRSHGHDRTCLSSNHGWLLPSLCTRSRSCLSNPSRSHLPHRSGVGSSLPNYPCQSFSPCILNTVAPALPFVYGRSCRLLTRKSLLPRGRESGRSCTQWHSGLLLPLVSSRAYSCLLVAHRVVPAVISMLSRSCPPCLPRSYLPVYHLRGRTCLRLVHRSCLPFVTGGCTCHACRWTWSFLDCASMPFAPALYL